MLDQKSLLAAIALSAAALAITMFFAWVNSRSDRYMLNWSLGMTLIVMGGLLFGPLDPGYSALQQFGTFALITTGFSFMCAGTLQFCHQRVHLPAFAIITTVTLAIMAYPFFMGWTGTGTIIANLVLAAAMAFSAWCYWPGRAEARFPMTANAALYLLTAISFALCSAVLVYEQRWVLTERPLNWAEDLNSIVIIIGLTGIGALSLTLNQFRSVRLHRLQAMTDALTDLMNRRALFERFAAGALPEGSAVVMFDLDHFKSVNDQLGHAAGDQVLKIFARLLHDAARPGDAAARLGGEEFCLVLEAAPGRSAAAIAETIRAAFETTALALCEGRLVTTVSAGVAISAAGGEPFDDVLRRADDALYRAKSAGRNRVHAPVPRLVA